MQPGDRASLATRQTLTDNPAEWDRNQPLMIWLIWICRSTAISVSVTLFSHRPGGLDIPVGPWAYSLPDLCHTPRLCRSAGVTRPLAKPHCRDRPDLSAHGSVAAAAVKQRQNPTPCPGQTSRGPSVPLGCLMVPPSQTPTPHWVLFMLSAALPKAPIPCMRTMHAVRTVGHSSHAR